MLHEMYAHYEYMCYSCEGMLSPFFLWSTSSLHCAREMRDQIVQCHRVLDECVCVLNQIENVFVARGAVERRIVMCSRGDLTGFLTPASHTGTGTGT